MINKKSLFLLIVAMFCASVFAADEPAKMPQQDIVITYPAALLNSQFYDSPSNTAVKVTGVINEKPFSGEIPIVGIKAVSNVVFNEVKRAAEQMLKHVPDEIKFGIIASNIKIAIIADANHQKLTQLPEYNDLSKSWDKNEGVGATFHTKTQSIGEINVTCRDAVPIREESVFIHEFAHVIYDIGLGYYTPRHYKHDPSIKTPEEYGIPLKTQMAMKALDAKVKGAYSAAVGKNMYQEETYMIENPTEYFAEGSQAYFNAQSRNDVNTLSDKYKMSLLETADTTMLQNIQHTIGINTYDRLKMFDPELFAVLQEVYGKQKPWDFCEEMPKQIPNCRFYCAK